METVNPKKGFRAVICSQSNFATDYRVEKMRQTLTSLGYDVTLLGRSHPTDGRTSAEKVEYMRHFFWHGPLFYAELNLRLFLRLLFGKSWDLIVSIDLDTLAGCQATARIRGTRLMWDSHELFPEVPEIANKPMVKKIWWAIQNHCVPRLRKTDIAVTVCKSIADIFLERYGREFLVVRNAPLASRLTEVRNVRQDTDERTFTILYQGAVNVGRGVEEMIIAMPQLPNCRFIVVGDGDVLNKAKNLAAEMNVSDRVEFVGRVPFKDLAPYMAKADVGLVLLKNISLNYFYALPNRVFDFVSAGLPIIGSRLPEIEAIVEKQQGQDGTPMPVGMCVDTMKAEELAEAIKSVISDPDRTAQWRKNMEKLAPRLTWEHDAEQIKEAIKRGEEGE